MKFKIDKSYYLTDRQGSINFLVIDWLFEYDAKYFSVCFLGVCLSVTWIAEDV